MTFYLSGFVSKLATSRCDGPKSSPVKWALLAVLISFTCVFGIVIHWISAAYLTRIAFLGFTYEEVCNSKAVIEHIDERWLTITSLMIALNTLVAIFPPQPSKNPTHLKIVRVLSIVGAVIYSALACDAIESLLFVTRDVFPGTGGTVGYDGGCWPSPSSFIMYLQTQ